MLRYFVLGRSTFRLDLYEAPAFSLRNRTCFLNSNMISNLCHTLVIMGIEFPITSDYLLVSRMLKSSLNQDNDRLVHLVGNDLARAFFASAPHHSVCFTHIDQADLFRNADSRVSIRAISFRKVRSLEGFSNWLLACCNRRLNISCRRSRPFAFNSTSVKS